MGLETESISLSSRTTPPPPFPRLWCVVRESLFSLNNHFKKDNTLNWRSKSTGDIRHCRIMKYRHKVLRNERKLASPTLSQITHRRCNSIFNCMTLCVGFFPHSITSKLYIQDFHTVPSDSYRQLLHRPCTHSLKKNIQFVPELGHLRF